MMSLFAINGFFLQDWKDNWCLHFIYVQIFTISELNLEDAHAGFWAHHWMLSLVKISNNPDVKMAFPVVMFCPYSFCLSIILGFWRSENPGCGLKVCSNNPHLPSEWGPAQLLHVHMVGALGGKVWWHIFIKQAEVCWRMPTDVWCCTDRLAWDAPWALPNLHRCNTHSELPKWLRVVWIFPLTTQSPTCLEMKVLSLFLNWTSWKLELI